METKKLMVSFMTIVSVLMFAALVSAGSFTDVEVEIDGTDLELGKSLPVEAGDTIEVEVSFFVDDGNYKDISVEVDIEGEETEVDAETRDFTVEEGNVYTKTLTLTIPSELDDMLSEDAELTVEIKGSGSDKTTEVFDVRIVRSDYDSVIRQISVPNSIEAGDNFPVEIVLENTGYNDLDDVTVTVAIPTLELNAHAFFGDIVALECDEDDNSVQNYGVDIDRKCDEDDEDTVRGRLFIDLPFDVEAGVYSMEVTVESDDSTETVVKQIVIDNDFESNVFVSGNDLWLVNPTNDLMGYRVVPESPASVSESVVFVPAGASKTLSVSPNSDGAYDFAVNIFTVNGELVQTVTFAGEGSATDGVAPVTNSVVVLTVVLAIVFLVLLIILIVLIGKKPEKSEELGESYY